MTRRRLSLITLTATMATAALAAPVGAANPSCTAQFTSAVARQVRPFGQVVVVPEVRGLTLGGRNLGQEVKLLLATADKDACPVTPA
jgi:hypothetical protein